MAAIKPDVPEKFSFSSSVSDDVWHPKRGTQAYEWWYFDALSDNGKDALVIIFLDNFIFSPRYNKSANSDQKSAVNDQRSVINNSVKSIQEAIPVSKTQNPKSAFPALVFAYYRDGKPCYR